MANFLALDSVLQVKSPKRSHSNPLVRELPVEVHSPLLHGQTSPTLKCFGVDQEVHVFLIKLASNLIASKSPWRLECFPANMLYFVFSQVQSGCYGFVGGIFERLRIWLDSSEPDH